MKRNYRYWMIVLPALLGATNACAPVGRGIQRIGTDIHEETIAMDHRVRDWFDSEDINGRQRNLPDPTTAYCYKTLGEVSCYAHPVAGQERRLVGKQEPEPMFAALNTPVPETKPDVPVVVVEPVVATTVANVPVESATTEAATNSSTAYAAPVSVATQEIPSYRQPRDLIPVFDEAN